LRDILHNKVRPERALRKYERTCRKAFAISFRGASLWRKLVTSGGLDVMAALLDRPASRHLLARCMAQM